ncbi:MAG: hypothetical protein CMB99_02750 [Flavobacteriaceae bacterium]|nr:hypothetical protein [Flavobacteriaceae bacterium]|tara:strand:- start:119131 stop:119388 length:258 start_codon:yes stop_codon:yes gene_type:complete
MKVPAMVYVAITTLLLVTVTIMSAMNFPFNWVFYTTVIGQVFVVIMVYKVLTDNYQTEKTFDHMYEDRPVNPKDLGSLPEKRDQF